MEPADHPCQLCVSATLVKTSADERSVLRILIEDDGLGFAMSPRDPGRNLGLANVHERLNMAYKGAFLAISSEVGNGTRVVIDIPR